MKVSIDRMRFKDWAELEQLTGRKMGWWVQQMSSGMGELGADDLILLVWVAGKRDNPALTKEEAGELELAALNQDTDPTQSGGD